jgi:hypothetical protein
MRFGIQCTSTKKTKYMIDIDLGENYCDEVEKIIGNAPSTRSLRCIFDPFASDWQDNKIEKKVMILGQLLEKKPLDYWTGSYANFYKNEANKPHVVGDIPRALLILYNNSDPELQKLMEPHMPPKPWI